MLQDTSIWKLLTQGYGFLVVHVLFGYAEIIEI